MVSTISVWVIVVVVVIYTSVWQEKTSNEKER